MKFAQLEDKIYLTCKFDIIDIEFNKLQSEGGTPLSPFAFLILGHLVGDYLFQTSWMAAYKSSKWLPLFVHSAVYTFFIAIFAWIGFGGLSVLGIAIVFIAHLILDQRSFVSWWVKNVMKATGKEAGWLSIVVDQIFHILVLALVLYL